MDRKNRLNRVVLALVLFLACFSCYSVQAISSIKESALNSDSASEHSSEHSSSGHNASLNTESDGGNTDDDMSPEKVFKISVKENDKKTAIVSFDIADGYQLYQEHFQFQSLANEPFKASAITLPKPIVKKDEYLGEYKVYKKHLDITVPLSTIAEKTGFRIQYQGCSDGFCYPPMHKQIIIGKNGSVEIQNISAETFREDPKLATAKLAKAASKEKSHAMSVESHPDSEGIIASASASTDPTTAESSGASKSSNTSANAAVAAAATAHSSSDAEPTESDTDRIADLFHSKNLFVTLLAFLGLGVMLACTPCVLPMVPILANILVGQDQPLTRKRSLYLASLYVLSVSVCYSFAGIAAALLGSHLQTTLQQPIFLIGLSFLLLLFALNQFNMLHVQLPSIFSNALHQLEQKQKHGSAVGAIAMGAISALMVSPCVTPALVGALTYIGQTGNAFLGGAALFALAFGMGLPLLIVACVGSHLLPKAGPWMRHIKSITGVLLVALAISVLMRAVPLTGGPSQASLSAPFVAVHDKDELNQALASARSQKKPVILDVYADWCISCRQMDKEVFENRDVLQRLSSVQLLRLDLTKQTSASEQLQKELGIVGPPMVLFFGPDGREAKAYRMAGKSETNIFIERLNKFLEHSNGKGKDVKGKG